MKKTFLIFALLVTLVVTASAQSSLGMVHAVKIKEQTAPTVKKESAGAQNQRRPSAAKQTSKATARIAKRATALKTYTNDTLYCTRTKKQHGWFAPMDTVSADVAAHRGNTYRFTRKNSAGHWEKLECVDAYGNNVKGLWSPYILKTNSADTDHNAKKEWIDRLKNTCTCEFISDPTGKEIVQEVVYDEQHQIVYTYSRIPVGNNQYIGSYRDHTGLPVEMRSDENSTYGTLIRLTEDRWGNDSVLQYVDAAGNAKLNSDSVALEVSICDRYGHLLKQQSRDAEGNLTKDNWGNCGVEYVWSDNHQILSTTYVDEAWQPMRMPAGRANTRESVVRTNYKYDEYLRQVEEHFSDEHDTPDVNALGTHSVCSIYDEKGNEICRKGYNLKGELSPLNAVLTAEYHFEYDDKGRLRSAVYLDSKGWPCSTDRYLSRTRNEYDADGNTVCYEAYSANGGKEYLSYKEVTGKDHVYTLFNDGTSRVDSLDQKGRQILSACYGADGKLLNFDEGYAREVTTYTDNGATTLSRIVHYDAYGRRVDMENEGICETIALTDSVKRTVKKWYYGADGTLKVAFVHHLDNDFSKILGEGDMNAFGTIARSGGTNEVRHYKAGVMYTQKGEVASLYGRDEFGEPDYIVTDDQIYYYQKAFPNSARKNYDVNNKEIEDYKALKDSLRKLMSIEVTDSAAYRLGLKDNDVILLYGDYAADLYDDVTDLSFRQKWTLRSVLDAQKSKRMVVFRVTDAANNEYGIYEIKGLSGTPSQIGFIPHIRYLTERQLARIQESVENETRKSSPLLTRADLSGAKEEEGENYVLLAYPPTFRTYRDKPYFCQVKDGAVLLASCVKDRKQIWSTFHDKDDFGPFEEMLSARTESAAEYPRQDFFLTTDGKSMVHMNTEERVVGTKWFNAYISDADYEQLTQLFRSAADSVAHIVQDNGASPKPKDYIGNWKAKVFNSDDSAYLPEAHYTFRKDMTYSALLTNYGTVPYNGMTFVFRTVLREDGSWDAGGKWLFTTPDIDSLEISCVDILNCDPSIKQQAVKVLNEACKADPRSCLQETTFDGDFTDNLCQIDFGSKNIFSAWYDNLAWRPLYFQRTKEEVQSLISIMAKKKE